MDPITLRALELAKESSDRARGVLLIMQVTCIVVFMAAWREARFGWTSTRLKIAQAAVWYLDCKAQPPTPPVGPGADSKSDGCDAPGSNQPFTRTEVDRAKVFLREWRFTAAQAKKQLESLQDTFVKQAVNVTVPVLGFTFDVNDLSVLGGISFLLILVWFYFSLRREELNIEQLFLPRKGSLLNEVYVLASMTQVLTVTPKSHSPENKFKIRVLSLVLKLLFFSPLAAQLFVLWIDWSTRDVAPQAPVLFVRQFEAGMVFLCVVAFATWRCIRRSKEIDKNWQEANSRRQVPDETAPLSTPALR